MKSGDLVCLIDIGHNSRVVVPGSLTAIKFFRRLYEEFGDMTGIITSVSGNNACVMFAGKQKVIHINMLKLVGCTACNCDPCDCDWGHCD